MNEFGAAAVPVVGRHAASSGGLLARLLLSALAIVGQALVLLQLIGIFPSPELPFGIERGAYGGYVVGAHADRPLPASLRAGDRIVSESMSRTDRAALISSANLSPGTPLTVVVARDGRLVPVRILSGVATPSRLEQTLTWVDTLLSTTLLFALVLVTLWRARDTAAWGLLAFSLGILCASGVLSVPVPPPANVWAATINQAIDILVAFPALYVTAEALARSGLAGRIRSAARLGVGILACTLFALSFESRIGFVYFGVAAPDWMSVLGRLILAALAALPVLVLLAGYRRADHESRLRIRWVLWSTALLFGTILGFALASADRDPFTYQVLSLLQAFSLAGFFYAVLRSRLVDVSFVIDRALVFALITAVLFGMFSLLEQMLHRLAAGERLSWAIQALAALAMAMALSPVHRRLERWIERLFFRSQLLAVATLRSFATECPFVEHEDRLLQLAVDRLATQCAAAAIYERSAASYRCRAGRGQHWPELVDVDDPLFVALRARQQELDLEGVPNGVAPEGFAFPMSVAETLTGAVLCRPRDGERFAGDVRAALAEVARNLGMSLYILRNREQARLVADLAAARIEESAARQRAAALIAGTS